jgi:hypothetical protein
MSSKRGQIFITPEFKSSVIVIKAGMDSGIHCNRIDGDYTTYLHVCDRFINSFHVNQWIKYTNIFVEVDDVEDGEEI